MHRALTCVSWHRIDVSAKANFARECWDILLEGVTAESVSNVLSKMEALRAHGIFCTSKMWKHTSRAESVGLLLESLGTQLATGQFFAAVFQCLSPDTQQRIRTSEQAEAFARRLDSSDLLQVLVVLAEGNALQMSHQQQRFLLAVHWARHGPAVELARVLTDVSHAFANR